MITTPSGHLRADYLMGRLERAVVLAHGREAFLRWRPILAEKAVEMARASTRAGRVRMVIELEKLHVKTVGDFSPEMWEYGRLPRRVRRRIEIEEAIRPGDPLARRLVDDAYHRSEPRRRDPSVVNQTAAPHLQLVR
jgi:hypothetical protein